MTLGNDALSGASAPGSDQDNMPICLVRAMAGSSTGQQACLL